MRRDFRVFASAAEVAGGGGRSQTASPLQRCQVPRPMPKIHSPCPQGMTHMTYDRTITLLDLNISLCLCSQCLATWNRLSFFLQAVGIFQRAIHRAGRLPLIGCRALYTIRLRSSPGPACSEPRLRLGAWILNVFLWKLLRCRRRRLQGNELSRFSRFADSSK